MLRFHRATIYLTFIFFYEYARGRYALNGRVTCFRTCLSRTPVSRITCHRLVYSYVPVSVSHVSLLVPMWTDDSSPVTCLSSVSPFVSSIRLLTFLTYAFLLLSR